jgi:hypothetical protein
MVAVLAGWAFFAGRGFKELDHRDRAMAAACDAAYVARLAVALSTHFGRRIWHFRELSATGRVARLKTILNDL